MEIIDFAGRIDRAIRRKLQPKIDPETNQFIDLTSYQKENIINIYMEFVQTYANDILDYLDELTNDKEFVDWCEKRWSNMAISIVFYHSYANILYATVKLLIDRYMRVFKTKCVSLNDTELYKLRLKETSAYLETNRSQCIVQ
jgi:hypothetical protein